MATMYTVACVTVTALLVCPSHRTWRVTEHLAPPTCPTHRVHHCFNPHILLPSPLHASSSPCIQVPGLNACGTFGCEQHWISCTALWLWCPPCSCTSCSHTSVRALRVTSFKQSYQYTPAPCQYVLSVHQYSISTQTVRTSTPSVRTSTLTVHTSTLSVPKQYAPVH